MNDIPSTPISGSSSFGRVNLKGGGDAQVIVDTALASADPTEINDDMALAFVLPEGGRVHVEDLERFDLAPRRKKGTVKTATVESFIAYVEAHDAGAATTVWVHPTSGAVCAVLDDHDPADAGWGEHRARLDLIRTDEWSRWMAKDGLLCEQEEFAEHIEDSVGEIRDPDAATMLEVAQSIHATNTATFRSGHRLQDGQVQMVYEEQVDAKAGQRGELAVPYEFELGIAPFVGEDPYRVTARLRFRIRNGKLAIGYRLDRPADVVREALDQIAEKLKGEFDNVYSGEPR